MKPRIKKANLAEAEFNPSFVGKWMCTYKSISGFGDTIEKAVLAMEKLCDFHATYRGEIFKHIDAQEYISQ